MTSNIQELQSQVSEKLPDQQKDHEYHYPTNVSVGQASYLSLVTIVNMMGLCNVQHKRLRNNIPNVHQM